MVASKRSSHDATAEGLLCRLVSRRSLLAGSIGTAAVIAVPDVFSARSDTTALSTSTIHFGIDAGNYSAFTSDITKGSGGTFSCRSYRDDVIKNPTQVPTVFPGQSGAFNTASIRPHPDYFLSSGSHYYDLWYGSPIGPQIEAAINSLIQNGCDTFGAAGLAPHLSVWHEAGNLYKKGTDSNGDYWGLYLTASKVRSMHVKMQNMVNAINGLTKNQGHGVGYGAIWYGDGSGTNGPWGTGNNGPWWPTSQGTNNPDLDWYGYDVYDDLNRDLSDITKVNSYMNSVLTGIQNNTNYTAPGIIVAECNSDWEANRYWFYRNLAQWLFNNGGKRMEMFYKCGEPSGCYSDETSYTKTAWQYIQNNYT
jgi:hypothetical protein